MNSAPIKPPSPSPHANGSRGQAEARNTDSQQSEETSASLTSGGPDKKESKASSIKATEETIVIKRTYKFAGETITEEKVVPKSSAEARLYLQSQATPPSPVSSVGGKPLRRPKKRPSMFEPNPDGIVKGLTSMPNTGPKLNTIEKSKLDWASHVDKEGLKEELDTAEKAKGGYMGRMEFLGRSEAKREEELKNARGK